MNIFKILQGGHGSISETNITAFLSYLLNPNKDHGLNDELLKRILSVLTENTDISRSNLVDRNKNIRNLSINSDFAIEVLPEQAFYLEIGDGEISDTKKNQPQKKIIDIVILCFQKKEQTRQKLATALLTNNQSRELAHIILIENKINDNSTTPDQLNKEINYVIGNLKKSMEKSEEDIKKIISLIFITPFKGRSSKEFREFKNTGIYSSTAHHLHWNSQDSNEKTMSRLLKDILTDEAEGKIEAINEYTKHTLKSFRNFIENGFKSDIMEDVLKKSKKDFESLKNLKIAYPTLVEPDAWLLLEQFDNYLQENYSDLSQGYYLNEPISIYKSKKGNKIKTKIFGLVRSNKKLSIYLIVRNFPILKSNEEVVKQFLTDNKFEFNENNNPPSITITKQPLNIEDSKKIFARLYQEFTLRKDSLLST